MDVSSEQLVGEAKGRFDAEDYFGAVHLLEELVGGSQLALHERHAADAEERACPAQAWGNGRHCQAIGPHSAFLQAPAPRVWSPI